MDWRIVVVFTPIVLAISWAVFNIGRAALGQLQLAIKNFKKNQSWFSLACFHPPVFWLLFYESFLNFWFKIVNCRKYWVFACDGRKRCYLLLLLFRELFTVLIVPISPHLTVVRIYCLVKYFVYSWFGFDLINFHIPVLVLFRIEGWYGYFVFDFLQASNGVLNKVISFYYF